MICFLGLVLLTTLLSAGPSHALEARAVVDRNVIDPSETVQLSVVVTGGSGDVDLSPITDFKVVSQGTSTSVQIVNMQMTRETRNTYGLAPLREGKLTIPSLAIGSGKDRVLTEPIEITVIPYMDKASTSRPGPREAFAEASVSDPGPWLGEPVVYTFTFLRRVQIADARFQEPSFQGFSVVEKGQERNYARVIDGVEYQVTEIRYRLLPLSPGEQTIEPAVLVVQVPDARQAPPRRRGFFDDPFFSMNRGRWRSASFRSPPLTVTVRELPPVPKRFGEFSGLLGTFSLSAGISPPRVPAGDSATLTLTVKGTGNVAEARAPAFDVPEGVRLYPDQPEPSADGTKEFRFALVPADAGVLTLGPFAINYFDPEAGQYRQATAASLTLAVGPGKEADLPVTVTSGWDEQTEPRTDAAEDAAVSMVRTLRKPRVAAGLAGIVLLVLIAWRAIPRLGRRFRGRDRETGRLRQAARAAMDRARKHREGDARQWADALYEAIVIGARLHSGSAVPPSPEELGSLFGRGDEERARSISALFHAVEGARFGGFGPPAPEREELTRRAESLVEEAIRKR